MSIKKTIGGKRLGSGSKMTVDLKTYNRSTHDLGYPWRSTMSAGTLVPFMKKVALPGDTFDINLDVDVKTHPTIGPLFGSFKVQLDIFQAPIRLYQSALHNNALGIGMEMEKIKLPKIRIPTAAKTGTTELTNDEVEKLANNPSSLLSHLGIEGAGISKAGNRRFLNGVPYLAYWDIYKNYYANKQEEIGMMIANTPKDVAASALLSDESNVVIPETPEETNEIAWDAVTQVTFSTDDSTPWQENDKTEMYLQFKNAFPWGMKLNLNQLFTTITITIESGKSIMRCTNPKGDLPVNSRVINYTYEDSDQYMNIKSFPLENIDTMRETILATNKFMQVEIDYTSPSPYNEALSQIGTNGLNQPSSTSPQQSLALKTYQSDLFNNWMNTEWIDGTTTGINAITAVDTSDGNFTIDSLNLAQKVYEMLNRIAISGGTYDDWVETVYTHEYINRTETPIYHGGLSKELVFQEIINTSASETTSENQPLGTLAGKGAMGRKHKGGHVIVKVDEPSYIMGIVSITPRIDYSQGNDWDTDLDSLNDFHKPALDEIGFQDLITEQMAWWTTTFNETEVNFVKKSAGKQPAWINYMTAVGKTKGNFALRNNEMFMTLNRRYDIEAIDASENNYNIKDLTTYIDPSKFNFIFAETELTSQNFWVQIACDITARRKMSAKIMPNL